jgi:DNA-binding CsgD family transcriptional regulator
LDVVAAVRGCLPAGAGLADDVLRSLAALVDADVVSYVDLDIATSTNVVIQDCGDGAVRTETSDRPDHDSAFFRHYMSTPSCSYPTLTGDDRTVTTLSDFCSVREWRATPMYRDFFREFGVTDRLMCCLPTQRSRTRRVIYFRSGRASFNNRDRMLLTLLRPHLADAVDRIPTSQPAQLTTRQWDLLRLVAAGYTNREIAQQLHLSAHTVRRHLENIYARLEVRTRTAAVAAAFSASAMTDIAIMHTSTF